RASGHRAARCQKELASVRLFESRDTIIIFHWVIPRQLQEIFFAPALGPRISRTNSGVSKPHDQSFDDAAARVVGRLAGWNRFVRRDGKSRPSCSRRPINVIQRLEAGSFQQTSIRPINSEMLSLK